MAIRKVEVGNLFKLAALQCVASAAFHECCTHQLMGYPLSILLSQYTQVGNQPEIIIVDETRTYTLSEPGTTNTAIAPNGIWSWVDLTDSVRRDYNPNM